MFLARNEPSRNVGGALSSIRIPKRFVWRHGGTNVYLIGSFTGWSDHLPMSPMEGFPTAFQVVCPLLPGVHQYKFYVDGEWRHDNQETHVTTVEYGVVNTVLVAPSPDILSAPMNPDTPGSRMNMDVDQEASQRVEMTFGISVADVDISRGHIVDFLSRHTAYELLPISGKVVALDVDLPVKQAFHVLYEQGLPIAPLLDSISGEFVGVLSPLDFILILKELSNHGSIFTEEELETHRISAWKQAKQELNRQMGLHGGQFSRRFIHASPYDTLKDIAVGILQNHISTIPIVHASSKDGSFPQLLHLATLSGILKCIWRHFRNSISLPILQQPVCNIPLGTWVPRLGESNGRPLEMLRLNASLGSALSLLVQAHVSSIPIVDDNDSLVDTYSRSDITSLAKDKAYARTQLDEMSIQQALQLRQEASLSNGPYNGQTCHMCLRSDSLQKVIERLSNPGVRRLYIVEAGSKRVEGVISLNDVFRYLLGIPPVR